MGIRTSFVVAAITLEFLVLFGMFGKLRTKIAEISAFPNNMEEISTNIKDRVLEIADYKQISREKFFSTLSVGYGNFKGKSRESALSSTVIAEISAQYPDINLSWLLHGNGKMILSSVEIDSSIENLKALLTEKDKLIAAQQKIIDNQEELLAYYREQSNKPADKSSRRAG